MIRSVLASVKKADETFALIDPGDRIAIGISGGKDSMCLLYAMHLYTKFSRKDFQIVPITLDLGFPSFDVGPVKEYAASLGYDIYVSDSKEVYPILLQHTKPGKHVPCSICSRMKKAAINDVAKKLGCNKVAFAHHRDDALETLWMNMIHGGSVSTFEPKMRLDRAGITFIRPFIFAAEEQLIALAKEEHIPVMGKTCPADGFTEREYCKQMLRRLYEERPEAKTNLSTMLYDPSSFRLYFDHLEYPNPENGHLTLKPLWGAEEAIEYACFAKEHGLPDILPRHSHFLLKKDHETVGILSFSQQNAHEIAIDTFAYHGIDEMEAASMLRHFETYQSRLINPLLFMFRDEHIPMEEESGYRKGMPPHAEIRCKRYAR